LALSAIVARSSAAGVARSLAAALGACDPSSIRGWCAGKRRPAYAARVALSQPPFLIPPSDWDDHAPSSNVESSEPASPPITTDSPDAPPEAKPIDGSTAEELLELVVARFRELDFIATNDRLVSVRDRAAVLAGLSSAIRTLARARGEEGRLDDMTRILKSKEWKKITETIVGALAAYPQALEAAGHALLKLDEARR
jgi:hypothetical protein